ncbi:PAS domain-containing protein [Sphingomonas agri]|uniref:PAS domain-containing protein n=1 Tax=Sphingomonas agri TaxID=1813878 RepID=UPI00311D30EE
MDSYREHPSDFGEPQSEPTSAPSEVAIGTDERRMHVRAYNYWVSLLGGRDFPSIEDLEPSSVEDFASNSLLLDFTCGHDNPALPYVGAGIREECGLNDDTRTIADIPSRSLLSRLTDHYMQIIANRAPVGFEAEFENPKSESICYRGILMPFSSDGEQIDFIYGVINWKCVEEPAKLASPVIDLPVVEFAQSEEAPSEEVAPEPSEPDDDFLELTDRIEHPEISAAVDATSEQAFEAEEAGPAPEAADIQPPVHFSWEDGPLHGDEEAEVPLPEASLDENAGLADRLWAARETAESVKAGEGRTRSALYKALSLAYDFAIAADENPQDYAELLEESGVKAQARAPMTPIVKLVFGVDYDKARLTEFAAALSFAQRQSLRLGEFQDFIEKQPGGLKGLVAAERQARRPEPRADTRGEIARNRLRTAPSISLADLSATEEFAVVVTRRGADGTHEPVAIVEDEALIERAIRRAA